LLDLLLERAKTLWSFLERWPWISFGSITEKKKGCWTEVISRHSTKKCQSVRKKLQILFHCMQLKLEAVKRVWGKKESVIWLHFSTTSSMIFEYKTKILNSIKWESYKLQRYKFNGLFINNIKINIHWKTDTIYFTVSPCILIHWILYTN
jgi:hypothetical protein